MPEPAAVHYRITALDPAAHLFEVRCTVDEPAPGGQRFRLPRWMPGSYLIREFARHFVDVRATTRTATPPCPSPRKTTARGARHRARARSPWSRTSTRSTCRCAPPTSTRRAATSTAAPCSCAPRAAKTTPAHVEIVLPRRPGVRQWRCATTMTRDGATRAGAYRAANYDELIDHPVEIGRFRRLSLRGRRRSARGRDHRARHDDRPRHGWNATSRASANGRSISSAARRPFDRYLFQVMAVGDGYGGLEHRSSTSLLCSRDELPQPGMTEHRPTTTVNFLGLASHEYFHAGT